MTETITDNRSDKKAFVLMQTSKSTDPDALENIIVNVTRIDGCSLLLRGKMPNTLAEAHVLRPAYPA